MTNKFDFDFIINGRHNVDNNLSVFKELTSCDDHDWQVVLEEQDFQQNHIFTENSLIMAGKLYSVLSK